MKKFSYVLVFLTFLLIFSISFTTSSDLNQDLSRHLKLGEIIWQTHRVPKTNLFSYTNPSFPFINHHWLAELFFYLVTQNFGLLSLVFIKLLLIAATVFIAVKYSLKRSIQVLTFLGVTLFSPLLLNRQFIRPEMFGYLFFALVLYITMLPKPKTIHLAAIPVIMLLWTNIHITYIFGLFILFVYFCALIYKKEKKYFYYSVPLAGFLVTFMNPHGLEGALYPLFIFNNYGYAIVENQNLFFLNSLIKDPTISYFFLLSLFVITGIFSLLIQKKYRETIFLSVFFLLSIFQLRHMPFFVFTTFFFLPQSYGFIIEKIDNRKKIINYLTIALFILLPAFILFFVLNKYNSTFDTGRSFGMGFDERAKPAAEFVTSHHLPGEIFNNFDIGGYAIYAFYPGRKVFIDNRPEAYPAEFIQKIYIPLHTDSLLRKKIFNRYNIHTIFFSHTDQTPWASSFIQQIYADNSWTMVFLNSSIIIFTDNKKNKDIKNDDSYFEKIIINENDYAKLLDLVRIFSLMGKNQLAEQSIEKAQKINLDSCAIKRYMYESNKNSPHFVEAEDIKKSSWFCF